MPKKKVILRAKSQQENPNQSQESTEDLIDCLPLVLEKNNHD